MANQLTMILKKIFFLLMILVFIIGCEKKEENELNLLSIDLITIDSSTFFAKTVILFEDSNYLIKTNLNTFINTYPFNMHGYDIIKEQVTQDSNYQDVLLMTDYLYQTSDSTFILAYHLENGSCLVFDKKSNEIIPKIEMEVYMEGEPMMSTGGRRFYIKGVLFLETV